MLTALSLAERVFDLVFTASSAKITFFLSHTSRVFDFPQWMDWVKEKKISCFCTFNDRRDGDIRKKIMMTTYLLICFLSLRVPFRRIVAFSLIATIVLCSCLRNWKHVYTRSLTFQNLIWKWSTQYHSASTVWASSPHIFCLKGSVMTFLGIFI
jgi:hypothetical protein